MIAKSTKADKTDLGKHKSSHIRVGIACIPPRQNAIR
jgi:hypothetical protein